jgi:hypothetical protein
MRQAVVDGTILVLEWHDSPRKRIGKEQIHVRTREQDRFLAPARGSLRSRQAGVGGRVTGPDYVSHAPGDPELSRGPEDIKEIVSAYHAAFPDLTFTVEKQVAEGDLVVTRWIARGTHQGEFMGVPPSGRRIEVSGMSMDRISGSRIVEHWNNWEALEMMEQIGAIPESEHTQGI